MHVSICCTGNTGSQFLHHALVRHCDLNGININQFYYATKYKQHNQLK